jgi:hypothetical protein
MFKYVADFATGLRGMSYTPIRRVRPCQVVNSKPVIEEAASRRSVEERCTETTVLVKVVSEGLQRGRFPKEFLFLISGVQRHRFRRPCRL